MSGHDPADAEWVDESALIHSPQFVDFNSQDDAKTLRKAMKGFGCDNKAVMGTLCRRTATERHAIAMAFKTMYGKDLIDELKSELRGDFEDTCVALLRQPAEYDAIELHHAMQGIGTDEADLIEIMCTRTNAEVMAIKQWYRQCECLRRVSQLQQCSARSSSRR